jgi:hypothetical protein
MRAICLAVQARQTAPAPALAEWQRWVKVFVAGLYHRQNAVSAALSARWEAAVLERDDPEMSQLGHAAADLAWAAVHAAAGEPEKAQALAHAARERLAVQLGTAVRARTLDGDTAPGTNGGSAPRTAGEHEADATTHARVLIERYGPTAAAEITALYAEMVGSGYWHSVSAKIKLGTAG